MTRAEIKKKVYEQFPIPKNCCAKRKEKIEQVRYEAIEKMIKEFKPQGKKEYSK